MAAIVVYESFWGNTADVARAIAEGIGGDTPALTTDQVTPEVLAGADLIVVGAPIIAFSLASNTSRTNIVNDAKAPRPADASHPLLRSWLEGLPEGSGRFAAFETGYKWSPAATKRISRGMEAAGYTQAAKPERFLVAGSYGPMKDGEIERARAWGATLAGKA